MKPYALSDILPKPDWKTKLISENGYNSDIIKTLNNQFPKAVKQCSGVYFGGSTDIDKARAIYNYLRKGIRYKKDPKGKQLIQLPARMIAQSSKDNEHGADCKSLSLAAAAFLQCQGLKNIRLRYASYDQADPTPTHVYAVATGSNDQDIIVDPVYKKFNAEAPYKSKKDYNMQISVLSGTPSDTAVIKKIKRTPLTYAQKLERLKSKVRPGGLLFTVVSNEISRLSGKQTGLQYNPDQLKRYSAVLKKAGLKVRNTFIQLLISKELSAINSGNFTGSIYIGSEARAEIRGVEVEIGKISLKKIGKKLKKISLKNIVKGVKAVGLIVPRKSFLALVALNVRGLATRMSQLSTAERAALWKKFGGTPSTLEGAIKRGKKKKPLFGAGKKVKAIKGIGAVVDESHEIGFTGLEVAGIIAAAAPILVAVVAALKKKGIPEAIDTAASMIKESSDFPEAVQAAADKAQEFNQYVKSASEVAHATGIIPEKPETAEESNINKSLPTDEIETATGSPAVKNTALIIGAAAVGAFMLMKKK